ncbi:mannose-1-phosphate guanylyltransferase/mannose-6-phosphate isomerase [Yoonia vestfoldensis]|uniref:mannose-1-phosphate guanylyltransferase/mannose-6-phosphate isomerase n=1 Tax=Yoonia vestfoldensis TaxID=245188 RepID=UPI003B59998A
MPDIHPILLCGGSGTRLWPVSRKSFPKQFTKIIGDESLFQQAAKRLTGLGFAPPVVVTGDDFRFIVTEQLAGCQIAPRAILIEPDARNTAPAILSAALYLEGLEPGALMLVAPTDHVFVDADAFRSAVQAAIPMALAGDIVTFGITPDRPETAYGYIELDLSAKAAPGEPQKIARFIEKPDAKRAAQLLASSNVLWNSGVFLFTTETIIAAARQHCTDLITQVGDAVSSARVDLGFTRLCEEAWSKATDISIDYAIMEPADNIVAMPYASGWSDLGSWDAVLQQGRPDGAGNVISSNATAIDCDGSLLRSDSPRVEVVGIDLSDLIVVATSDAVLVAPKASAQRVKEAVAALKSREVTQAVSFPTDHRPWGWFESLAIGDRFQVKRIHVKAGAALSLQSHLHRSEHWIVVKGTAKVTIGGEVQLLTENQSVYIPLGAKHRLENPGKVQMVLIEVQTGAYLGEDDIERHEDIYARVSLIDVVNGDERS